MCIHYVLVKMNWLTYYWGTLFEIIPKAWRQIAAASAFACFLFGLATLGIYSTPFTFTWNRTSQYLTIEFIYFFNFYLSDALTLNKKFFLWSGPHSKQSSNCGAPYFLLLQNSFSRDTGCLPGIPLSKIKLNMEKTYHMVVTRAGIEVEATHLLVKCSF